MIVLDTNVVSELARPLPDEAVVSWIDAQDSTELVLTALTAAEIRAGVALMPKGRRRQDVSDRMEGLLAETFAGYILPFDVDASFHYADVLARRRRAGHPISSADAQIASIALQYKAKLATRHVRDFVRTGVEVVDPWTA